MAKTERNIGQRKAKGIQAISKSSKLKSSKNYKKPYKGQGRGR